MNERENGKNKWGVKRYFVDLKAKTVVDSGNFRGNKCLAGLGQAERSINKDFQEISLDY